MGKQFPDDEREHAERARREIERRTGAPMLDARDTIKIKQDIAIAVFKAKVASCKRPFVFHFLCGRRHGKTWVSKALVKWATDAGFGAIVVCTSQRPARAWANGEFCKTGDVVENQYIIVGEKDKPCIVVFEDADCHDNARLCHQIANAKANGHYVLLTSSGPIPNVECDCVVMGHFNDPNDDYPVPELVQLNIDDDE